MAELYEMRRKTAYLGSRMHFFRELWNGSKEKFILKVSEKEMIKYGDVVEQDGNKNIFITIKGF